MMVFVVGVEAFQIDFDFKIISLENTATARAEAEIGFHQGDLIADCIRD